MFREDNFVIPSTVVTECVNTRGDWSLIFGIDIITRGDFAITNKGGKSKVSFRITSIADIDFLKEDKVAMIKAKHLNKGSKKSIPSKRRKKKR